LIPGFTADVLLGSRVVLLSIEDFVPRDLVSEANERLVSLMGRQCQCLIVDCSRMTEISSKGVGLVAYQAAELRRKGGEVLLIPPSPPVAERLGIAALHKITRFFPSVEEAVDYARVALGATAD